MRKVLFALFFLSLLFFPQLVSFLGKSFFAKTLEQKIGGPVQIECLQLCWSKKKIGSLTLQNPLLISIQSTSLLPASFTAQQPLTLQIEPEDFLLPFPYSLEKLNISKATLDAGKIQCQRGKTLTLLMSILNPDSTPSEMEVWLSPIEFQMDQGLLKIQRFDALLSHSVHICAWGNIDLTNHQLNATLGLNADTLERSFGIERLPEDYVLTVPVQGTVKDPEIAKGAAVAKIATLIATNQKGFLGDLAALFASSQLEADIPPAKRPFSWEKR